MEFVDNSTMQAGMVAYCERQANMHHNLCARFEALWTSADKLINRGHNGCMVEDVEEDM